MYIQSQEKNPLSLILLQCVNGKNKNNKKRAVLVFLCNEQTPLLIARIAAYDFVTPAAHNSMIVVICEFLNKLVFDFFKFDQLIGQNFNEISSLVNCLHIDESGIFDSFAIVFY